MVEGNVQIVHIRLPVELVKRVDHLAVERDSSRAACVEWLLEWGLRTTAPVQMTR